MATIKKYTKDNQEFYMFQAYLGINPQTGKEKRTTRRGFKTRKEARLALSKLELQADLGQLDQQPVNLTFEGVYKEWWESYINTVRESTRVRVNTLFRLHVLPAFGKYRIATIKASTIQRELNKWFKSSDVSYKQWFNYTNKLFKYAILQGYISFNPCQRVIVPKRTRTKKAPNFWDKEQLQTFFNYIDPNKQLEQYTLFRVLAFTGIRRGECLALTWDDVNMEKETLSINKTVSPGERGKLKIHPTKTIKGDRVISLDKQTLFYLRKWQLQQKKEYFMLGFNIKQSKQLVFATSKNTLKSLDTPHWWLKHILVKTDLPQITIHGFRHSHASALFSAGATIKEVQERLGHENSQTTLDIYTHITESQDKEAVQKLVNYLDF